MLNDQLSIINAKLNIVLHEQNWEGEKRRNRTFVSAN